jgi:hypothetical protein
VVQCKSLQNSKAVGSNPTPHSMDSEQNWLLHLTVNQAPSAYGVRVPGCPPYIRRLAQSGSASALGAEGRRFESCISDQFSKRSELAQW